MPQRTTRWLSLTETGQTYLSRVRNVLEDIDEARAGEWAYPGVRRHAQGAFTASAGLVCGGTLAGYLKRRGTPLQPADLTSHDCLRLKHLHGSSRVWRMWCPESGGRPVEVEVSPVLSVNHTGTLLLAALDGAGITSVAVDVVAPYLNHGALTRVLSPWITGKLAMYAARPSRKFIPQRTRVFLDYLVAQTWEQSCQARLTCRDRHTERTSGAVQASTLSFVPKCPESARGRVPVTDCNNDKAPDSWMFIAFLSTAT